MTNNDFNQVIEDQLEYCRTLLCKKGEEYDSDTNCGKTCYICRFYI